MNEPSDYEQGKGPYFEEWHVERRGISAVHGDLWTVVPPRFLDRETAERVARLAAAAAGHTFAGIKTDGRPPKFSGMDHRTHPTETER